MYNQLLISEACSEKPVGLLGLGVCLAARQTKFRPDVARELV
jgi:hypothetical protein